MEKNTNQRQIILNYLKKTTTHPTAEEIYQETKKILPFVSRSTVYRNLNYFVQKGKISELIIEDIKRFDGNTSSHFHFFCLKCKKVYDIIDKNNDKNIKKLTKIAQKIGKINNFQINFFGVCKKCRYY